MFMLGILLFSVTPNSGQDSLAFAKILNDFNNRPIGVSNEVARKLMLNQGTVEKVVVDMKIETKGMLPWSIYTNKTSQEVWYQNGWHTWTLSPNIEINKSASFILKIMVFLCFFMFFTLPQIEGIVRHNAVKNNRVYGNPVDEFTKLSEKKMLFDTNIFSFLFKEGGFLVGALFSVLVVLVFSSTDGFRMLFFRGTLSFLVVCFGGLMNAWWYKKSLEKLSSMIFGTSPPSDDD